MVDNHSELIQIEIDEAFSERISVAFLQRVLLHVLDAEEAPLGLVSVVVTDNDAVRELNRDFLGIDEPTDVLSFPSEQPEGVGGFVLPDEADRELGDIYIALAVAERQASDQGISLQEEVGHLLTHGALHLLGYDHIEPDDDVRMRAREESLLSEIGIVVRHAPSGH